MGKYRKKLLLGCTAPIGCLTVILIILIALSV